MNPDSPHSGGGAVACRSATKCRSCHPPLNRPVSANNHTATPTLPTPDDYEIVDPFIIHIAILPEVSCHRISLFPSPLKSPVPIIDQTKYGALPTADRLDDSAAVHEPDRHVARGVVPKNVGLAVTVNPPVAAIYQTLVRHYPPNRTALWSSRSSSRLLRHLEVSRPKDVALACRR